MSVLAAAGKGKTVFNGIEELKFKESNRVQAIIDNLINFGIKAYEQDNSLIVEGWTPTQMPTIQFDDHRIAMAFVVLSIAVFGEYKLITKHVLIFRCQDF